MLFASKYNPKEWWWIKWLCSHAELLPVNNFDLKQVLYFRRVSEKLGSHCTYVDGSEM